MALKKKAAAAEPPPPELEEGAVPDYVDPSLSDRLFSYLRECTRIDPLNIQEEFVRIPSDLAFWNAQYADAQQRHLNSKIDCDVLRSQLTPLVRQALADAGGRVTESQVEAAIESHDEYIEARRSLARAESEKSRFFGYLDAVRSKKEMLISLGATLRAELEGDPTLREHMRGSKMDRG